MSDNITVKTTSSGLQGSLLCCLQIQAMDSLRTSTEDILRSQENQSPILLHCQSNAAS